MGVQLSSGSKRGGIVGINVTPMVDVVLVLLVIMMVSATYIVAQSLKVELPKSASSDEAVTSVAAVSIDKTGKLFFNQQPVTEPELIGKLREAKSTSEV
ncbi:MAG TPA: biopolymer transporter ExbD, partial [Polyangiaceae bacterium]